MTDLFTNVVRASLYGSIVIGAVCLLRLALKRAPKSFVCLLWLLVGVRLVMPFEIESSLSLQPRMEPVRLEQPVTIEVPDVLVPDDAPLPEADATIPEVDAPIQENVTLPTEQTHIVYAVEDGKIRSLSTGDILACIWLVGMAAMMAASLVSYWKLKRTVREAWLTGDGCWECDRIDTAFVLGFLRPRIYLPVGLGDREREFILSHERTHIARRDHLWKLLGYGVLALHWFNPLVWLAYSLLCRDMELACDEHVVKHMDLEQRKAYSGALLSCAAKHGRFAACPVAFGETDVKGRIQNVLNYKRPGFWITVVAIVAALFVAVCLVTSPADSLLNFIGGSFENLDSVGCFSGNRYCSLSSENEIEGLESLLKAVSVDPGPMDMSAEENAYHGLDFGTEYSIPYIRFSEDCSLVWLEENVAYRVKKPEKLRSWFEDMTEAVRYRETSGEPFATMSEPLAWLQGISENAVKSAEIDRVRRRENGTSYGGGYFAANQFGELIELLNGLQEAAIVEQETLALNKSDVYQYLESNGGVSITIFDHVNQVAGVLQWETDDTMRLILTDQVDDLERNTYSDLTSLQSWVLEDGDLLAYMKAQWDDPTTVGYLLTERQLTTNQWRDECQLVLDTIWSRDAYHILEIREFTGRGTQNTTYTRNSFRYGDYWLRIDQSNDGYAGYMGLGQSYFDAVSDDLNFEWRQVDMTQDAIFDPWLYSFNMSSHVVEALSREETDEGYAIRLLVEEPFEIGLAVAENYYVDFCFDHEGNFLRAIQYVDAQEEIDGKIEFVSMVNQITVVDVTGQDILNTIRQYAGTAQKELDISLEVTELEKELDETTEEVEENHLTTRQWTRLCEELLKGFQTQDTYALSVEQQFTVEDAQVQTGTQHWYHHSGSWLCQSVTSTAEGTDEVSCLNRHGLRYSNTTCYRHHEENGLLPESATGWVEVPEGEELTQPWLVTFDWDAQDVTWMAYEARDGKDYVTFRVQGNKASALSVFDSYEVTFVLRDEALYQVMLNYSESWRKRDNSEEAQIVAASVTMTPQAVDTEVVEQKIVSVYNACKAELCTDETCTDASHGHEAQQDTDCTTPGCTDVSHGHSHHDH